MKQCPACGSESMPVMYLGLPGRICRDEACSTARGAGPWVATFWFVGALIVYEGSCFSALWKFTTGGFHDDGAAA